MGTTIAAPLEHQSVFGGGHQAWKPGNTCDECLANQAARRVTAQVGVLHQYGIKRWHGVDYMSDREQEKQVVASARAKGYEPVRYEPSERYKN